MVGPSSQGGIGAAGERVGHRTRFRRFSWYALAFIALVVGVLLLPKADLAVTAWERMAIPVVVQDPTFEVLGVATAPNPGSVNHRYFAWAVGSKRTDPSTGADDRSYALAFDRSRWVAQEIPQDMGTPGRGDAAAPGNYSLNAVSAWRYDWGPSGAADGVANQYDFYRAVAVGWGQQNPGRIVSALTASSSGVTTAWNTCLWDRPGGTCESIRVMSGSPTEREWSFNDIDLFDGGRGIIVGQNAVRADGDTRSLAHLCNIWITADGAKTWNRPTTYPSGFTPAIPCQNITSVSFAQDFSISSDTMGNRTRRSEAGGSQAFAWLVMEGSDQVWFSSDYGDTWTANRLTGLGSPADQTWVDVEAVYYQGRYHVWLTGQSSGVNYVRYRSCTSVATCGGGGDAFVTVGGLGSIAPRGLNDLTVTATEPDGPLTAWLAFGSATEPGGIAVSESILAGGGLSAIWVQELAGMTGRLNAVAGADPGHAFAGGVNQTLLKRQPGNLTGWAWFGADSCSRRCAPALDPTCLNLCPDTGGPPTPEQPLGWMSLTCVNSVACLRQAFSYGLTVVLERDKGYCSNDSSRSCTADPECVAPGTCVTVTSCAASPAGTNQRTDVGALSGYAWIGADDPDQTLGGAPASRPVGWVGFDRRGICSNNSGQSCTLDADCGGANTCQFSGLVSGVPVAPPSTPFNSFPSDFVSACNKTITASSPQRYAQAFLDYRNDRVEGWARIASSDLLAAGRGWIRLRGPYQCGQAWCSANRSIECVNTNGVYTACPAGAGTCDATASEAVKCVEMGYGPATPPLPSHYAGCTDCQEVSGKLECNICSHVKSADWWNISYATRRPFQVNTNLAGQVGDTVTFTLDLNILPGIQADFDDVRVIYKLDGGLLELPREITPVAGGQEQVRFKLVRAIVAGGTDSNFFLYYNSPSASTPTIDPNQIYSYGENFTTNVFTGATPWSRSTNALCNPAGSNVFQWAAGQITVVPGPFADNCYAWNPQRSLDMTRNWNVEATLIQTTALGQPNVQSLHLHDTTPLKTGWWSTWADVVAPPLDRVEVWRDSGRQVPPAADSTVYATTITSGVSARYRWNITRVSPTLRSHSVWVNDTQLINAATESGGDAMPALLYPGFHVYSTQATIDNLRVWPALGESASFSGPEEAPSGSTRYELWSCNSCGKNSAVGSRCGTGRCDPDTAPPGQEYKVCRSSTDCGAGNCAPSGFCSSTGAICFTDANCGAGRCEQIGENVCDQCDACSLYGVSLDPRGGSISGFGYSQDFGFVDLSLAYLYNPAWFQALQGSIYAGSNIGSPATRTAPGIAAPVGDPARVDFCNATFGIHADGSISNVCSGQQAAEQAVDPLTSPYVRPDFGQLGLPTAATGYQALLDTLHLDDLTTEVGVTGKNVFGSTLLSLSRDATWEDDVAGFFPDGCLNNTVIVVDGDFTLNPDLVSTHVDDDGNTITFEPCPLASQNGGRGTLVVKGNLAVTTNMQYVNTPAAQKVSQIPSFGVIVVRANASDPAPTVTINEDVEKTAFNLFTEGTVTVRGTSLVNQTDRQYQNSGVMVAASFSLNRNFTGTIDQPEPAERITDDGRLRINPPPGFEGFGQSLPQIRESRP